MNERMLGRRLIAGSAAIAALGPFGMHVLLPALPAIAVDFSASASTVQLLVSLSLVAIGLGNLIVAPLSDRFGRRSVTIAGLCVFLAGSIGGLLAPSLDWLIAARIVQAFGGGAAMAVARASITDFFGIGRSANALATMATAVLVIPMFAPILGGFAVEPAGWRAAFAMASVFCAAVLYFVVARLQETHVASRSAGPSLQTFASYRRLLGSSEYLGLVAFGSCMMGAVTVFITSAPYVAIDVLGVRPSHYGLLFFLPAFAAFAGFFYTARMAHRLGGQRMMRTGATLSVAGAAALVGGALLGIDHPLMLFLPGMLVCGGNALATPHSTTSAITSAPEVAGAASGMLGFIQLLVGAAATQLVAVFANQTAYPLITAMAALSLGALALLRHLSGRPPARA